MMMSSSLVWGAMRDEEICVDFQANNNSNCFHNPFNIETNHSFQCKSVLIGVISPESCDSGPCKFKDWIFYIGLIKLIDLLLNTVVLTISVVQYARWEYGSELQIGRPSESGNYAQLGFMITDAVACGVMIYFGRQFFPVIDELVDMGCLSVSAESVGYLLSGIPDWLWAQFLCQMALITQFLANKCYYHTYGVRRGRRHIRIPKDSPSNEKKGFELKEINGDRMVCHFSQVSAFFMIEGFGLLFSALSFYVIIISMPEARDLVESATTQGDTTWCFYCRGERHAKSISKQHGTDMAVLGFGCFFLILDLLALLGTVVAAVYSARNNLCCNALTGSSERDRYHSSENEDSFGRRLTASAAVVGPGDNGMRHRPGRNSLERNQKKQTSPHAVSDIKIDFGPGDSSERDFTASGADDIVIPHGQEGKALERNEKRQKSTPDRYIVEPEQGSNHDIKSTDVTFSETRSNEIQSDKNVHPIDTQSNRTNDRIMTSSPQI